MPYVELHARSAFTFLEGASLPEDLTRSCEHYQIPAMVLLDRNGVYGAPRFHLGAKQHDVKAHVGAEITVAESGNYPLLAQSRTGYQNLCRLVTTTKLRSPKKKPLPALLADLEAHSEG